MEAIAVVGMGCRFPGGANNPDLFWQNLSQGKDSITPIPKERWDIDSYYDPDPEAPGKMYVKEGGFLDCPIDEFDNRFFEISPREAEWMDPQQRLMLEVAWEALEYGGIDPTSLYETQTGVFIGVSYSDYERLITENLEQKEFSIYRMSGSSLSIIGGRVAYYLGLNGPSWAVDTACSSSMVAIHQAIRSLQYGDSDCAIAGGVNLMLAPDQTLNLCKASMLSPEGRCKIFDQSSDGFVRSEGCGVVVLKRMSDAVKSGNRILAIIRSSAINQDGASTGLAVPNPEAQEKVIRKALEAAELKPNDLDAVEAHGTGTSVGDPIEAKALEQVFIDKEYRVNHPLMINSVKSCIGHTETASGVAGLIKSILSLQNEEIPANLHHKNFSPESNLGEIPAAVPTTSVSWTRSKNRIRRTGVSSFGMTGTNVHLILEEAPAVVNTENQIDRSNHIVTLSAKTKKALNDHIENFKTYLEQNPNQDLGDISHTMNAGRAHFENRIAIVATNPEELASKLANEEYKVSTTSEATEKARITFLYPGQGSLYFGMGQDLYKSHPIYKDCIDQCDKILSSNGEKDSLAEALYNNEALLQDPVYAQLALFATEYAMTRLLHSFGIEPDIVLGHSWGEYAASVAASAVDLEEAMQLIVTRARLCQKLATDSCMVAIEASEEKAQEVIDQYSGLEVAAVNSGNQTVISGKIDQCEKLISQFKKQGLQAKRLPISHGFHSSHIDSIMGDLEKAAKQVNFEQPKVKWISSITGEEITKETKASKYWVDNTRAQIRFPEALEKAATFGANTFIEVGPQAQLLALAAEKASKQEILFLPTLRKNQDGWSTVLDGVATLYVNGYNIDWLGYDKPYNRQFITLPTYPFQRSKYWLDFLETPRGMNAAQTTAAHFSSNQKNNLDINENRNVKVDWVEDSRLSCRVDQVSQLPELDKNRLKNRLKEILENESDNKALTRYQEFQIELDNICYKYIFLTLKNLGLELEEGAEFNRNSLIHNSKVIEKHSRLFSMLLDAMVTGGFWETTDTGYRVLSCPRLEDIGDIFKHLRRKYPEFEIEPTLLNRTGENLAGILKGEIEPLSILFPQPGTVSAEDFYHNSVVLKMVNRILQSGLETIIEEKGKDVPLRILEVGAGTGATTNYILPKLPREKTDYVFTDVSPLFLEQAEKHFKKFPFVHYQVLDAEVDPKSQGLAPGQFDIIIASNVLHATRDIRLSVKNVTHLLAPGGYLLLIEGSATKLWAELVFGTLKGWWRFEDSELRQDHMLLTPSQWHTLLNEEGYSEVESFSPKGEEQSVIIAHRSLKPEIFSLPEKANDPAWIVFLDSEGTGESLVKRLKASGESVITVKTGSEDKMIDQDHFILSDSRKESLSKLFNNLKNFNLTGIVYCRSLNFSNMNNGSDCFIDTIGKDISELASVICDSEKRINAKLFIATKGGHCLPGEDKVPEVQKQLLDTITNITNQKCAHRYRLIDLAIDSDTEYDAGRIFYELFVDDAEAQVALRQDKRWLPKKFQVKATTLSIEADTVQIIELADPISESERMEAIQSLVEAEVRRVLKWSQDQPLDYNLEFFDIGLDSLMAVELTNRLQKGCGDKIDLAAAIMYQHSSINKLCNHINKLLKSSVSNTVQKTEA